MRLAKSTVNIQDSETMFLQRYFFLIIPFKSGVLLKLEGVLMVYDALIAVTMKVCVLWNRHYIHFGGI
jgi:hypothetical protein